MGREVSKLKKHTFRAAAFAAVALLVLSLSPGASRADLVTDAVDWNRASHYVGCALGIVGASTGVGMAFAAINCLLLFAEP